MTHEELVKEARSVAFRTWDKFAHSPRIEGEPGLDRALRGFDLVSRAVLALIAERLKEPTETTLAAAFAAARYGEDMKIHRDVTRKQYCAMLAVSPLVPPKTE